MAESGDHETLPKTVEPPIVYDGSADDIGSLSGEELESLVAFYTDLYWMRDQQDIEGERSAFTRS